MKVSSRILELKSILNISDIDFEFFKKFFNNKILLADYDGSICDTNQVKDKLLGEFFRSRFLKTDFDGNLVTDARVNKIHKKMHGISMDKICQEIMKEIYTITITDKTAKLFATELNKYIKQSYINSKIYDKASEYHELLHLLGVEQYILTEMENTIIEEALQINNISKYFQEVLGSKKTKDKWVKYINTKHKIKNIFATGNSLSEYDATKTDRTIFIGFNFENKKKRIFPETTPIVKNYDELIKTIISIEKIKEQNIKTEYLKNQKQR